MVVQLSLDYAAYTQGLDKSDQAALRFARNTQRNFDEAKASVTSFMKGTVASAAGAIGAMIAVNESFSKSLEFNKSIAQISTQIDGSISDLKRLEAAAKSMSVQFGTLPVDQAKAFYEIISSGTDDIAAATDLLSAANKLAIGGITDLATSVDGLTNIMNSYSGKVESAEAVSDALFVGMKAGKATMEEFSSGLGKVTPLASSLNVSFDELVASIAALSKQGISAREGITGMRAILAAIAKPTKEARDMAESLGIEFNVAGLQAKGFAGFLDEVTKRTGGNADALALLFGGVEALVPAMAFAGQAGQDFNAIMADMENKAGATQAAFEKMAASPGFKIDQLMASINNIAITLGDTLAGWLVPAAEAAANAINNLFGIKQLSAVEQQTRLIADLRGQLAALNDRKNIPVVGDFLFNKRDADLLEQRIYDAVADLSRMEQAAKTAGKETATLNKVLQQVNAPKALSAGDAKNDLGKRVNQVKQLASESERLAKALQEEGRRLTEQIDPLVKKNNEIDRYKTLLESGAISEGIYSQAVERSTEDYLKALGFVAKETDIIEENTKQLGNTARDVFDSMEQIAIQGVRNIQSSFADGIFNFFDRGLNGMVDSVVTAIGRMASEFASIKLLQAAGGLFGLGGASTAFASGGGGAASALSLASLGSSAASLFSTGFGATSLMSGLGSALPGAAGSFFTGMGVSGGGAAASAAGFSGAASMGASFAAAAGPAIALYATTAILKSFAGDKRMGGGFGKGLNAIGDIPIIGDFIPVVPLMNTLFGRGPYKFREQQILGNVSASGFDGEIADVFKSKGGLFLGNKHRRQGAENESEIIALFDSAIQGFAQSARGFADALGLDASAIDSYNEKIFIRSQKTKQFTEEEIGGIISSIGDNFARKLIPEIDRLAITGESASQTMARLGGEFDALSSVLEVMGVNAADALSSLKAMSFEQRNSLVTMAGGVDALNQKTAFFFENILTDADRLEILSAQLTDALADVGVTGTVTVDQLREAVQSGTLSAEQLNAAFNLAPLIQQVDQLSQSANVAAGSVRDLSQVQSAFSALDRSVEAERNRITDEYNARLAIQNERIQDINASINKLNALAGSLKSATEQLRPLGLTGARNQIVAAIEQARAGNFPDSDSLRQALQTLGNQSTDSFGSRADFIRSQTQSASLVDELGGLVDEQLLLEERSLSALESARDRLTDGFENEIVRLNGILENAKMQVDLLSGIDTTLLSIADALKGFNSAVASVPAPSSGASSVSDSDIRSYFSTARTPQEIAADAAKYGLSSGRIAAAAGFTPEQVDKFFRDNPDIPRFATGASFVPSTGPAIVHRGERIINPEQNQDLIDLLRDLVSLMQAGTAESAELRRLLRNAMQETDNGMAMTTVAA